MSIWFIVIIIIILAVVIFGYFYCKEYSGGALGYKLTRNQTKEIIEELNKKIIFNDINNIDPNNTRIINDMKTKIISNAKPDYTNNNVNDNYLNQCEKNFYAKIDLLEDFILDDYIKYVIPELKQTNNGENFNYRLVKKYCEDLFKIKKLGDLNDFINIVNDDTISQDELNKRFRCVYFNNLDFAGLPYYENKELVQKIIINNIDRLNSYKIKAFLKYKYKLFKSENLSFDGTDDKYIENFYNTKYQEELINKINTHIHDHTNPNDDLIDCMFNYYTNVHKYYSTYLVTGIELLDLEFFRKIPHRVNDDTFANERFKLIQGYSVENGADVAEYIEYYHDIDIFQNTTYTYIDTTDDEKISVMRILSVRTIYGMIYYHNNLFNSNKNYKLEHIDIDNEGVEFDCNIENVELLLLLSQMLDYNEISRLYNNETIVSKKEKLKYVIDNILINLNSYIKKNEIDDFNLPHDFIINLLKNYNKRDILFNDIYTELVNQNESYNILLKSLRSLTTSINIYAEIFWQIAKIKYYNKKNFDVMYRINIYGRRMIIENNADTDTNYHTYLQNCCENSHKDFTDTFINNLNNEIKTNDSNVVDIKACLGIDVTDPIITYNHIDGNDSNNGDGLLNKLEMVGIIVRHGNNIVVNKYENLKLCEYNYNYDDYMELFPSNRYNIEYLRREQIYICDRTDFINIGTNDKNYLKWELKCVDKSNTTYYDELSVSDLYDNITDFNGNLTDIVFNQESFSIIINGKYGDYIHNRQCIYFFLQNKLHIPEYIIMIHKNTPLINKEYFEHMIILFPDINIPPIDKNVAGFYNKEFSYKNAINSNNDIVVSDVPYGDKHIKKIEYNKYFDIQKGYRDSLSANGKSIINILGQINTSDSKNKKNLEELAKALIDIDGMFDPNTAFNAEYTEYPIYNQEFVSIVFDEQYIKCIDFLKLIDIIIAKYKAGGYNDPYDQASVTIKKNLDDINDNNTIKYVLDYKFAEKVKPLIGDIIYLTEKRFRQEDNEEITKQEEVIVVEQLLKEYNQVLDEKHISTKEYSFSSSSDTKNFIRECMIDLINSSSDDTKASIMYMKVDDLSVLDTLNDIDVNGTANVIYIAGYVNDLNKEAIMNELNKTRSNNNLFPKVKKTNTFTQTRTRMFAFKKQGNKYVRDPANDAFFAS